MLTKSKMKRKWDGLTHFNQTEKFGLEKCIFKRQQESNKEKNKEKKNQSNFRKWETIDARIETSRLILLNWMPMLKLKSK